MINWNSLNHNKTPIISSLSRISRCGCVSSVMSLTSSIFRSRKCLKRRILSTWWRVSLRSKTSQKRTRPWFFVSTCRAAWTLPHKSREKLISSSEWANKNLTCSDSSWSLEIRLSSTGCPASTTKTRPSSPENNAYWAPLNPNSKKSRNTTHSSESVLWLSTTKSQFWAISSLILSTSSETSSTTRTASFNPSRISNSNNLYQNHLKTLSTTWTRQKLRAKLHWGLH